MVYTTRIARTIETALPIAKALGVPLASSLATPNYGAAEGRTWSSVLGRFQPPLAMSPHTPMASGADSWAVWVQRVGENVEELAERHPGETVILVCHRESVIAVEQHCQRGPVTLEYSAAEVDHTAFTEWERKPLGNPIYRHWRWVRLRHNDILHMAYDGAR